MVSNQVTFLSTETVLLPETLNEIINSNKSFSLRKHDASTTVGIIKGGDFNLPYDLLVKRFNYRGFFDFLVHKLFRNKAKLLWDISIRLRTMGLPVPEPIFYVNASFAQKQSFYLSRAVENADKLSNVYRSGLFSVHRELVRHLARTIAEWHLHGAVHGDLKWPNILLQEDGHGYRFFLIDLDQVKIFRKPSIKGIRKDLTRFYRFGLEIGASQWVDAEFLPEYSLLLPVPIKDRIDFTAIANTARKEWMKKGQRRY